MKYWLFADHKPQGPYELGDLKTMPSFGPNSQVCKVGDDVWQKAESVPEMAPLVAPHKIIQSGDFITDDKPAAREWRQTVIPVHNVFANTYKPPVQSSKPASSPLPAKTTAAPKTSWLQWRKSKWTMAALWTLFFGLYVPQMDQIDKIIDQTVETSLDIPLQGFLRRAKNKGRFGWKKNHTTPPAAAVSTPPPAKAPAQKKMSNEKVLNEEITEMANGVLIKTVISEVRTKTGKKQIKTRRYIRMNSKRPFEPL